MSSTNRGGQRIANDVYNTPQTLAEACLGVISGAPSTIWEPNAGAGSFVRAARNRWPFARVFASDIDSAAVGLRDAHAHIATDALTYRPRLQIDMVVGNPPFATAQEHIEHAYSIADTVGFILRLNMLEGKGRIKFWEKYRPSEVYVLSERPSFTSNGKTDSIAYAWYIWYRHDPTPTKLYWLSWR